MLSWIYVVIVTLAIMGIGLFLVVGTLRRVDFLVRVPQRWYNFYPYWFLRRFFGEKSFYYFHICIGVVFFLGGIGILLSAVLY